MIQHQHKEWQNKGNLLLKNDKSPTSEVNEMGGPLIRFGNLPSFEIAFGAWVRVNLEEYLEEQDLLRKSPTCTMIWCVMDLQGYTSWEDILHDCIKDEPSFLLDPILDPINCR